MRSISGGRSTLVSYAIAPIWLRIAEPAPDPISEAELSLIWEGRRFPPGALTTPDGTPVEVVYPGHRDGGAGPDFRDAVVRLAGEERRGDVELHVRASAFRGHGHHVDPAYDGLVLHVVYRADAGSATVLSSGATTPVAAFAPWVERRAADLRRWLEGSPLWEEPCRGATARLGEEEVRSRLAAAGQDRFANKVSQLREAIEAQGEETALWRGLFAALGYGPDRGVFRRLAETLPPEKARQLLAAVAPSERGVALASALLALAGLASPPEGLVSRLPAVLQPRPSFAPCRPANRPERRLAALAYLYLRAEGDFVAYVCETVAQAQRPRDLIAAWQAAAPGSGAALLGPSRAAELVLNVVLPFAATRPALAGKGLGIAAALSAQPPYGKTAFLERNLRLADGRRLARSACEQQGLLALLADWCSQGGCGRCPLS